ncbi:hypothetical protein BDR26DRAFT_627202 [Obelidium mucronatum]|nr:hypothetical protein BDR26DRAFT_627202 [Obelidium mucronatum]
MGAQDADSILHSRSSVCDGYSNLFLALCEAAPRFEGHEEIYAFKISGLARGVNLEAGDTVTDLNGHAWNSVYVNGEYRFIESTWAAGSAEGNSFKKLFLPIPYFLAAPELFIYTHIPSKGDSQQYLPEPLTHQEWLQLPHTGPAYRINGMRLLSATGLKPTSHNMLSFIETDDDYMELRIELSANLDVSTGGCRIIGHICPGVSGPPMILYPNAVARLPNAPHSDQLKASPSVPTSAMMFHWDEVLDDRNKRIAVFRGYLPRGESVIRVMAQMSSDSEHCYQAIQFRVCNHGSGRRHPPPG